jgi:hypothetical protein
MGRVYGIGLNRFPSAFMHLNRENYRPSTQCIRHVSWAAIGVSLKSSFNGGSYPENLVFSRGWPGFFIIKV